MTASTMQAPPIVPARPSRSPEKDGSTSSMPKIPPRPVNKRLERSISPNPDRFAPSPLNEGIKSKSSKSNRLSPGYGFYDQSSDPIDRSGSVPMPSVGEEGLEYSAVTEELKNEEATSSRSRPSSPEQTRTVAEDLKLHAPKPSLPAHSAKQRVAAVTRTDSDKAASFGIGRPSFEERAASREGIKKKPSTTFSTASDQGHQTDEEHGIPEIGQRVPMNPNLGDVQAPSPAPSLESSKRNHVRKHSARGLPPGSYGLHGHGVVPQDSLDKAWYQKHPDQKEREQHTPLHDRQNDFAMSSADLNRLVRDTANRASGLGASAEMRGTPTDEVAFLASEEYASRMSSPRPASAAQKGDSRIVSPLKNSMGRNENQEGTIHVDDDKHPEYRSYGNEDPNAGGEEQEFQAPILASDEVDKDPSGYLQQPAIHPPPERRGSAFEMEDGPSRPTSRPSSRPSSRPASIHHTHSQPEFDSTPLEDVQEYEPLFPDETKEEKEERKRAEEHKARHHFPSKDIWEDAPNSVHYTAQVSTPDVSERPRRPSSNSHHDRPLTPAQAFALHQEELAEQESRGVSTPGSGNKFLALSEEKPTWISHQSHLRQERPSSGQRFPSRDIWEDAPESLLHQTTVSASPQSDANPDIPARPVKKLSDPSSRPAIPDRPKPKQLSGDDVGKPRPVVSDKPKPQIPARPNKTSSGDSKDGDISAKPKPPVPSRPVGNKIAALQAGFMSDLNKRLQLGPQAPKKEEPTQEEKMEEKEKVPLSDARKSRARGPQRRAPARSPAAAGTSAEANKPEAPTLSFTLPQTVWTIDPDRDGLDAGGQHEDEDVSEEKADTASVADKAGENSTGASPDSGTAEEPEATKLSDSTSKAEDVETISEENQKDVKEDSEDQKTDDPHVEDAGESKDKGPEKEEKTLVANTAGESILEATVEKTEEGNEVDPVEVADDVKA